MIHVETITEGMNTRLINLFTEKFASVDFIIHKRSPKVTVEIIIDAINMEYGV